MKKLLKSRLFAFVLGLVLAGSIGALAYNVSANNIGYNPEWTKSNGDPITKVNEALDELYTMANEINYADLKLVGTYQLDSTHTNTYTQAFDLSQETNYQNLQESDFYVVIESIALSAGSGGSSTSWYDIDKTYNSTTGSLTITVPYICYANYGVWLKGSVYLNK